MKPIDFKEKTKVLNKPDKMTDEQCSSLAVWNGNKEQCISCWKASFIDRVRFLFTGKIWLWVWFGETQPPVYLGIESPFDETEKDLKLFCLSNGYDYNSFNDKAKENIKNEFTFQALVFSLRLKELKNAINNSMVEFGMMKCFTKMREYFNRQN